MANLTRVYQAVKDVLRKYPALSAALLNIAVAVIGYFGLKLTSDQLVYLVSVATALFGVLVHMNVTPVAKSTKDVK
jgi:uncharacterized membrane protein